MGLLYLLYHSVYLLQHCSIIFINLSLDVNYISTNICEWIMLALLKLQWSEFKIWSLMKAASIPSTYPIMLNLIVQDRKILNPKIVNGEWITMTLIQRLLNLSTTKLKLVYKHFYVKWFTLPVVKHHSTYKIMGNRLPHFPPCLFTMYYIQDTSSTRS